MPNLTDNPVWEAAVYQLALNDRVLGGPGGIANQQAQQLANRTAYLKEQVDNLAALSGSSPLINISDHSVLGNGVTDETSAIQTAINTVSGDGGGTIVFPAGTYRIVGALTIPSNIALEGTGGATILIDTSVVQSNMISATGTQGSEVLLTANAAAGDKTISVASIAGISPGDWVSLYDTRSAGRYPVDLLQVESAASGQITFRTPILVSYLTANGAGYKKQTFVENVAVRNLIFRFDTDADVTQLLSFTGVKNLEVRNCQFVGHRASTAPTSQVTVSADRCFNVLVADNFFQNGALGSGNAVTIQNSTLISLKDNHVLNYASGIGLWNTATAAIEANILRGLRESGNRGIKIAGSFHVTSDSNSVSGFDSGFKIEDCGSLTISDNQIQNCGLSDAQGVGIDISHLNPASGDNGYVVVSGNRIKNQKYIGIYVGGSTDANHLIHGNHIENCSGRGIHGAGALTARITSNYIYNWGTAYPGSLAENYAGITFSEAMQVEGNTCIHPDGGLAVPSFYGSFSIAPNDGTTFVNNVAPTKSVHSLTDFEKIGQNFGNTIYLYGQKRAWGTAAPTAGLWERGDVVWNSLPSIGAPMGWRCTTGGTPGTWEALQYVDLTSTQVIGGAKSWTGKQTTAASASGGAGFNLPHGSAPSSPVNGDVWTTTLGFFSRINGVIVELSGVVAATVSTIVKRGADGTVKAANHSALGTAAAAESAIVADNDGYIPAEAINSATLPVADAALITSYLAW